MSDQHCPFKRVDQRIMYSSAPVERVFLWCH